MSSHTRERFPLYHDECRAQLDMLLYSVLCWFFLSFCHAMVAFEFLNLGIFFKINLEQTVGTNNNNVHCKVFA